MKRPPWAVEAPGVTAVAAIRPVRRKIRDFLNRQAS